MAGLASCSGMGQRGQPPPTYRKLSRRESIPLRSQIATAYPLPIPARSRQQERSGWFVMIKMQQLRLSTPKPARAGTLLEGRWTAS